MNPLAVATALVRRGVVRPGLPHRVVAQLASLATWGYGLGGELRQAALRSPNAVAVVDESMGEITYAELLTRATRVAFALRDFELGPDRRVGLLARNHVGAVEIMAGAGLAGVDLVLLNTGLAGHQLALVAVQQHLALVLHDEEFDGVLAETMNSLPSVEFRSVEAWSAMLDAESTHAASTHGASTHAESVGSQSARPESARRQSPRRDLPRPDRPGRTIILTSGTTGAPKGAARRNPKGLGPLVSIIERIPVDVGDTILISAPIFHTWGFAALQLSFAMRATVVLQRRFDPALATAALSEHGCHAMFAIPVMLQRILDLPDEVLDRPRPRLRIVATSGSRHPHGFTTRFMDRFGEVIYNLYGSTEASWVCIATPADLRRHPDTAGTPPLGTIVRLLDDDGQPVPEGRIGRIFVGNALVFEGYTAGGSKEFVDGLVATGDVGHVEDGLWFVDGRDDDMVISGGENVYPVEVETVLITHPAVREVSVCGIPDPEFGERMAAFVAVREGHELTAEEVKAHVRDTLARHCVPREVVFVEELPRNATGKVLVRELRTLL